MKDYEKELKKQLERAQKAALVGLGFVIVAQRKLEKAAKEALAKGKKAEVRAKAGKLIDAAVKEQKAAQKKLEAETKKALSMLVKESKKRLDQLDKRLNKK